MTWIDYKKSMYDTAYVEDRIFENIECIRERCNKGVVHIHQSFGITGVSPSDCLLLSP